MYKNYLLAITSGLLLALAWPTYGFSLLIFVAFVPLLIAEHNLRKLPLKYPKWTVFSIAYLAFLVWNSITTWWIWKATPFGGVFAIVVNSWLMSMVFLLYHLIAKRKNTRYSLIFLASIWIAFEKFHHNWDFSWPWLSLGNVFSEDIKWIQWYEFTGIFGGSAWVLFVNFIFYSAWLQWENKMDKKIYVRQILLGISIIVIGISVSMLLFETYKEKGIPLTAVVLQPSTDPYTEKYHQPQEKIADDLVALATPKMDSTVRFVLAPETVFSNRSTYREFTQGVAFYQIEKFEQQFPKTTFLTGVDLYEIYPQSIPKTDTANRFLNTDEYWYEGYNAAMFIAPQQKAEVYHKSKLVVGVEHFPFRKVLEPLLGNVLIDLGGSISTLTPQKEVSVFKYPNENYVAAPIICYESIYGEFVTNYVRKGANFLAIITNDSWWGNTQGHKQLLSYARLRAIENRRAVARSANSGISAFINQKGELISTLGYETKGALKGTILANDELTFYAKYGDFIARIAVLIAGIFFLSGMFRGRVKE